MRKGRMRMRRIGEEGRMEGEVEEEEGEEEKEDEEEDEEDKEEEEEDDGEETHLLVASSLSPHPEICLKKCVGKEEDRRR